MLFGSQLAGVITEASFLIPKWLVGCTTDRELHPAPKVFIWLSKLYPSRPQIVKSLRGRGYCMSQLCLDDALDRANRDAFLRVMVTNTLDTGFLIDHIGDAVAFADRFGGTFRYARAAGDAFFGDFHGHGCRSRNSFLADIN